MSSNSRPYSHPAPIGAIALVAGFAVLHADVVPVRHTEGIVHGFLAIRALDGKTLGTGDLIQLARGNRVTSRLVFHFKDGSIHEETATYTQLRNFRLLRDHLVQKGPSFPRQLDMTIATGGTVTVRYTEAGAKEKIETEHLELPEDVSNGLILTLLKNVRPDAPPKSLSYVSATPKPRLVKVEVTAVGRERFSTGTTARTATHYSLKAQIGGLSGLLAPLVGKEPPESHVWILAGEAPAFVKSEQPLYYGGPVWRIELVSPTWPPSRTSK